MKVSLWPAACQRATEKIFTPADFWLDGEMGHCRPRRHKVNRVWTLRLGFDATYREPEYIVVLAKYGIGLPADAVEVLVRILPEFLRSVAIRGRALAAHRQSIGPPNLSKSSWVKKEKISRDVDSAGPGATIIGGHN